MWLGAGELAEDAEQPMQLGVLARAAGVAGGIRRAESVKVCDSSLDGPDDLEEGGTMQFGGWRLGGSHRG